MNVRSISIMIVATAIFAVSEAVDSVKAEPAKDSSATATLTGVVKLEGTAPKPAPISMTKEPTCAKMHTLPAMTEEVITDGKGALQNVVVFVAEGLPDSASGSPPSEPAVIDQKACTYHPHVIAIQANQKIRVVNSDQTSHNIHPLPRFNREWNKSQPPGQPPFEESFAREEIAIPVKCNVHSWMRAYIAVLRNPYFAVTGNDGTFEITKMPTGTYTISAWHEKYGTMSQTVSIGSNEKKAITFTYHSRPN
jgi:plastocyanin